MSYIDNNLMNDEEVVYKATIHWIIYTQPVAWAFLLLCTLFGYFYLIDPNNVKDNLSSLFIMTLAGLFLLSSVVTFISAWIVRASTELAVTSKRVIAKSGLIKRKTIELNHSKTESFSVDQSILGRVLGYGTLTINGTGGVATPIKDVDDPLVFRKNAMNEIDLAED